MTILGIDTSQIEFTSIGIYFSESEKIEINYYFPCSQEEKLLYTIDLALKIIKRKIEDIDVFVVGLGPGSFTGLRIGVATIKGLAWALNKKVIGFSSLDLLLDSLTLINNETIYIPVIDAKMNKIFCAIYKGKNKLTSDIDIEPEKLINILENYEEKNFVFFGNNISKFEKSFLELKNKEVNIINNICISGIKICEKYLNNNSIVFSDISSLEPFYLRKSAAEEGK